MMTRLKSLGYANGWGDQEPIEVRICKSLGHVREGRAMNESQTHHRHECNTCGYYYDVDSSD